MNKYSQYLLIFLILGISLSACRPSESRKETPQIAQQKNIHVEDPPYPWTRAELMGQFDPHSHEDFEVLEIPAANREGIYLRKEVAEAFRQMRDKALQEGIQLQVISGTRTFDRQRSIWNRKWSGATLVNNQNLAQTMADPKSRALTILQYSSMPGSSRHHWGTDIDINNLNNSYFDSGRGLKEYNWLSQNAGSFGFCQVYTPKGPDRQTGYEEEKWHWSYLPLSRSMTVAAREMLTDEDFIGFDGNEVAQQIGIVNNYILGIHPDCIEK